MCEGVHMVLEIAEFTIRSGEEDEFAVAYERASRLVRDTPGGARGGHLIGQPIPLRIR